MKICGLDSGLSHQMIHISRCYFPFCVVLLGRLR